MNPVSRDSLPAAYFEDVYRRKSDPWDFATSAYEAEKYAATLAALPGGDRFQSALELGCSIGVFTAQLAPRCQRLLAVDVNEIALAQARVRCAGLPGLQFQRRILPDEFPGAAADGSPFDLIVMSEVGYYFSPADLGRVRERMIAALSAGGLLLLVHWTPRVPDYPLTGDEVHAAFLEHQPALAHLHGQRAESYRLDLFKRPPAPASH
jgi:SAM-dependent methyltransferase